MRSIAIVMLATVGLGCAHTLPIHLPADDNTPGLRALVVEAGERLGLEVHFVDTGYGAVTLDLVDRAGHIAGHSLVEKGCRRAAWALAEVHVVAHELGHVLGLEHVSDTENLMHIAAGREGELDGWQLHVVERQAARLELCRVE